MYEKNPDMVHINHNSHGTYQQETLLDPITQIPVKNDLDQINYEVFDDDEYTRKLRVFGENVRIYKLTTSFSHLLGNITSVIGQYLKDTMPRDFFKQFRVTTEEAFKDIKDRKKNLIQSEKPYLIIDPKILMGDESQSLPWAHWDKYLPHDHMADPMLYLMNHEFFYDERDDYGFSMGYTVSRYKFQFNITILVETQMQQLNLINYLKSNFRFMHMYPIRRYMETLIPKQYIDYIAEKYKMNIESEDFLQKLNLISPYTILRLYRPATGHTEFFILQEGDIQIKLPNYPEGQRNMRNRIDNNNTVTFPIEVETNLLNNFLMLTSDEMETTELISKYMTRVQITSKAPIVDNILDNKMSLYYKVMAEFDHTKETVDLTKFLSYDTLPLIKYINDNSLMDDYVQVRVYKWTDKIDHTDVNVMDFNKRDFTLELKALVPETVYTISLYFDMNFLARIKTYINPVVIAPSQIGVLDDRHQS